jgi:hypothetical protein
MKLRHTMFVCAALAAMCVPPVFAQAQQDQPTSKSIQQRKENQQDRIAQGVKSGQLTPRETRNLENKEVHVNKEEHNMRRADNGHLTQADKNKLNRQQNKVSKDIYADKHNARTTKP